MQTKIHHHQSVFSICTDYYLKSLLCTHNFIQKTLLLASVCLSSTFLPITFTNINIGIMIIDIKRNNMRKCVNLWMPILPWSWCWYCFAIRGLYQQRSCTVYMHNFSFRVKDKKMFCLLSMSSFITHGYLRVFQWDIWHRQLCVETILPRAPFCQFFTATWSLSLRYHAITKSTIFCLKT